MIKKILLIIKLQSAKYQLREAISIWYQCKSQASFNIVLSYESKVLELEDEIKKLTLFKTNRTQGVRSVMRHGAESF